jgi:hypothetical protein
MRSPTCLLESRVYSLKKFAINGAKDFYNTICQKEIFATLPARLRMDLLRLDAGRLDDRPPLLDFGLMQSAECFWCLLVAWRDFAANSSKP